MTGCSPARRKVGDSIRCGRERLRLLGIVAPGDGPLCTQSRVCVPGGGRASVDRFSRHCGTGRLLIAASRETGTGARWQLFGLIRVNLSLWQLGRSQARYRGKWDHG